MKEWIENEHELDQIRKKAEELLYAANQIKSESGLVRANTSYLMHHIARIGLLVEDLKELLEEDG